MHQAKHQAKHQAHKASGRLNVTILKQTDKQNSPAKGTRRQANGSDAYRKQSCKRLYPLTATNSMQELKAAWHLACVGSIAAKGMRERGIQQLSPKHQASYKGKRHQTSDSEAYTKPS